MVRLCSAVGCKNRQDYKSKNSGITFHKFPTDARLKGLWLNAMRRYRPGPKSIMGCKWDPKPWHRLCSAHFAKNCFRRESNSVSLKNTAVPTIFDFPATAKARKVFDPSDDCEEKQRSLPPTPFHSSTSEITSTYNYLQKPHNTNPHVALGRPHINLNSPLTQGNRMSLLQNPLKQLPTVAPKPQPVMPKCEVCHMITTMNTLLVCHKCGTKAHPACLGYSAQLALKSRQAPWLCMDCKHCSVCDMDHNIGTLIFCDECDSAYHLCCHQPPLRQQPQGTWVCCSCVAPAASQNVYDGVSGLPTPRDSPVPDDESSRTSAESPIDSSIPDASHWTTDLIALYFENMGYNEAAVALKEQAVDGPALLMMCRNDVLTGLGLKLGPALKLYKQVRILQTRTINPILP